MQNVLSISASGDIDRVTGYQVKIYNNDELIGTYDIGNDVTEFDLNDIGETLDIGFYQITVTALFDDGTKSDETVPIDWYNTVPLPACAPMTLRFKFSKSDYAPVDSETGTSVTTKGTWNKLDAGDDNIWDWTYDDPDWSSAFQGVFADEENEASVIDAGDTSGVTNMENMFAGVFTGNLASSNYVLSARNNVVSCVPFDVSGCLDFTGLFTATAIKNFVQFESSNLSLCSIMFADTQIEKIGDIHIGCKKCQAIFSHNTKLKKVGNIHFDAPNADASAAMNIFANGASNDFPLEEVGNITGTGQFTMFDTMFQHAHHLKRIGSIDVHSGYQFVAMFRGCYELENIPELVGLGNTNITNIYFMFSLCYAIKELPLFDTSHVTNAKGAFRDCYEVTKIPNYDFSSVTNVEQMLKDNFKIKEGILETYDKLLARGDAITNHADCFTDCGRDTEEGRAQLYQISQDWGGLKPNISITFKFHDPSYSPAEHQLGVGKAVTGEDKYEQNNKSFSAEWVCLNSSENIWMWCVTEGTNLSNAFVYGDGTEYGVPMLSGEDYITGIPEELTLVEGGTRESLMHDADDMKYGTIDQEDWVPEFEIVDWDLENATDITCLIGTNVWYKNNLVGTLPALRSSSIGNIGYAFDRCWNVTAMGPIDLPNCSGANNAFMTMMGLEEIPEIEAYKANGILSNTFHGCLHVSKESIEDAYEVLSSGNHSQTENCFKKCGIEEDPDALENIPVSWGGTATIVGTNVNGTISPLAVGDKILRF